MKLNGHAPRKRFGQHFLSDQAMIEDIIDGIAPLAKDNMVEIGPGLGAMTAPLIKSLDKLLVVELDRDLAAKLRHWPQLTVVEADVLTVDFSQFINEQNPTMRVVGNLPYNISTPILFHLLQYAAVVQDQHFMLQKEVIDRMVAKPKTAQYGRLSVMLQARYEMENILFVPSDCFTPPPRVDSAIVRMIPLPSNCPSAFLPAGHLENIVKIAFSQRRKILKATLGAWAKEKNYVGNFDMQRRAEEVSVDEYIDFAYATQGLIAPAL